MSAAFRQRRVSHLRAHYNRFRPMLPGKAPLFSPKARKIADSC
jgi:hypothetical protein